MSLRSVFLLVMLFSALRVGAQTPDSTFDALLQKVEVMWVENPIEARVSMTEMVKIVRNSDNNELKVRSYIAKAKTSMAFSLDVEAVEYIDSALNLAYSIHNYPIAAEVLLNKLNYCRLVDNETLKNNVLLHFDKLQSKVYLPKVEVHKLLMIGDFYQQKSNLSEATRYKELALKKSVELANDTLIAECQQKIGNMYWFFGNFKQAQVYYSEALLLWQKCSSINGSIEAYKNLGLTYRSLGQYELARQNFSKALDLALENQDKVEEASILNLRGGLNLSKNKFDEALDDFVASYAIFEYHKMLRSGVATLQNIARVYIRKTSYDTALQYLNEALQMQEQLMDPILESSILNDIGNLNLQKGDITEALKNYLMSLKIRKKCGDRELEAKSLVNIGLAYRRLGMLGNAAKYLEQVLDLINDNYIKPVDAAYALQNLAHVYSDQNRYDTAIETYKKSLSKAEQTGDEIQISRLFCNIAQTQIKNNQFAEARNSLTQALKISQKKDSKNDIANIYNELGNIKRCQSDFQHAIVFYKKGLDLYSQVQNENGRGLCFRKIGEAQIDLGNFAEAEQNINRSIEIGKQIGNNYLLQYGYLAKYKMYAARGSYKNALHSYVMYSEIMDSIQNSSHDEKIFEAQIDLELDQKTTEIKLMEAEMEALRTKTELDKEKLSRQSMVRDFLVVIIVLVVLLAAILIVAFIQKRSHARVLEEKIVEINLVNNKLIQSEGELKETIQRKDKLFSIVAHDLRSPFTALVGLTELMAEQAEQYTKDELVNFSKTVNSSAENVLSLIENLLQWSRSQTGRLFVNPRKINLLQLVQKVEPTARMAANLKKIDLVIQISPDLNIFADDDTITTVIRNLVSNAIKFTFENGKIAISATQNAEIVRILVADNGIGITPQNINKLFKVDGTTTKGTNGEGGTGLGLVVCKEFVEKNGGSIAVESAVGKGTTFIIELKTA